MPVGTCCIIHYSLGPFLTQRCYDNIDSDYYCHSSASDDHRDQCFDRYGHLNFNKHGDIDAHGEFSIIPDVYFYDLIFPAFLAIIGGLSFCVTVLGYLLNYDNIWLLRFIVKLAAIIFGADILLFVVLYYFFFGF